MNLEPDKDFNFMQYLIDNGFKVTEYTLSLGRFKCSVINPYRWKTMDNIYGATNKENADLLISIAKINKELGV